MRAPQTRCASTPGPESRSAPPVHDGGLGLVPDKQGARPALAGEFELDLTFARREVGVVQAFGAGAERRSAQQTAIGGEQANVEGPGRGLVPQVNGAGAVFEAAERRRTTSRQRGDGGEAEESASHAAVRASRAWNRSESGS